MASRLPETVIRRLIRAAAAARRRAYAPYSRFRVGAAVLAGDGTIITGCNVENASYGLTTCAERVAIHKAVSEGRRRLRAIAVVGGGAGLTPPCGACRQVLAEFGIDTIILAGPRGQVAIRTLADLLPEPFGLRSRRGHA